jgi:hypothetical protein
MSRLSGSKRYNRLDDSSSSSWEARPTDTLNRQSHSLKAILKPRGISLERRRASTESILEERQNLDLEAGYPAAIDANVILPATGAMEDASSISDEGYEWVGPPSFSDGTETDGSFLTAPMIPAVQTMSIGAGDFSRSSDQDFLSCREGSDQFSTGSVFADARSIASLRSSHRDSDGDSFYTCRRFNDQGLRSVLAVPVKVNTDHAFNIPLHVFAETIAEAALRKQTEHFRNQFIWRPVKIMSFLAVVATAIALAIVLSKGTRATEVLSGTDGKVTPATVLVDSVPSAIPSMAPLSSSLPSTIFSMPMAATLESLVPSAAPWPADNNNQWTTISPTSFVLITGNFEEIDDWP